MSTAPTDAPRHRRVPTPLGDYLIAAEGESLTGVWRDGQAHFPGASRLGDPAPGPDALLDAAAAQLREYLDGEREAFDLPTAARGTDFQQAVWRHLTTIPRGATTTYGAIARALGTPRAAQAVGAAVGANPLSIVVPCHRVLGSTGSLTGYAGGLDTKRALLRLEGAALA
ncbi:methylated-DNA--[protein]-cysteine S-methyltransferase [Brachybacterium saurashtrense]|uniref:Methylated-DNA--protein-cysteine methyltransferase n=1 Tax=Brachybacterium saurashtrense TaxID=556288 RepID=A0A345YKR3_9MICO|nr:methylated-DNA--[protein]-cysteine S-methyltransferase [Brachybacterium saurashtrense]AXK44515.1 methylated-DNA--[protein]-cysteine S-methyltransferase [Brachybacterium saurashtrense]RRR23127.1 methylated-DNA--[protein]-cysteine S-methyltransferase [Brachybacterium saurashtrense]